MFPQLLYPISSSNLFEYNCSLEGLLLLLMYRKCILLCHSLFHMSAHVLCIFCGGMCCTSSRHSGKFNKGSKLLVSLATIPRLTCLQDKLLSEISGAVPRDNDLEVKAFTSGWTNRKQAIDNLESEWRSATSLRAKLGLGAVRRLRTGGVVCLGMR